MFQTRAALGLPIALAMTVFFFVACFGTGVSTASPSPSPDSASIAKKKQGGKAKAPVKRRAVIPSTGRIFGWIKDLTSLGYRRTGTPGGRRAAVYVRDRFKRFGLKDVSFQTARSYSWKARNSSLSIGGVKQPSFPIAHSVTGGTRVGDFGTGKNGLTAGIVDVGDGTTADFAGKDIAGKVVLFDLRFLNLPIPLFRMLSDYYYDPRATISDSDALPQPYITNFVDVAQRAMDGGAAGVVGVLADYFDSDKYYNENYRRLDMDIPGVWVTRNVGASIRARLAENPTAAANLRLNVSRGPVQARNVVGFLPGRSKETILISSHHDAVFDGAVEDASGTAEVLALAKYFATLPKRKRQKSLMFATMDSHFTGYQAHMAFTDKYILGVPPAKRPVANVAIEHIGRQGLVENGKLKMTAESEVQGVLHNVGPKPLEAIKQAIERNRVDRTVVLPAGVFGGDGIPTDASFSYAAGVPVISLISGPIYLYDKQDTIDKIHKPHLRPVAKAFAEITEDLGPLTREEIVGSPPGPTPAMGR
ncbi:MAG TPA: M28 family peptidase [Solirubrobacterales bacterium]|nr:M28 family peptidase [Solirubrobacterales bacterium]